MIADSACPSVEPTLIIKMRSYVLAIRVGTVF